MRLRLQQLALDAQQFRHAPALVVPFGHSDRVLDRIAGLFGLSDEHQALRQRLEISREAHEKLCLAKLVDPPLEQRHPGGIPPPDEQHAFHTKRDCMVDIERLVRQNLSDEGEQTFGSDPISDIQDDR